jgi:hypothetical protein
MNILRYARLKNSWGFTEMADEIIKVLCEIKDKMPGEYGYDVKALVDHLREKKHRDDQPVVDIRSLKRNSKSAKRDLETPSPLQQSP